MKSKKKPTDSTHVKAGEPPPGTHREASELPKNGLGFLIFSVILSVFTAIIPAMLLSSICGTAVGYIYRGSGMAAFYLGFYTAAITFVIIYPLALIKLLAYAARQGKAR